MRAPTLTMETLLLLSVLALITRSSAEFSMSMRDVGITDDIHRAAASLNDVLKESFELMVGSLGKHGVYYVPELRAAMDHQTASGEKRRVEFQASNGWMKNPKLTASDAMRSGALRKYKVPLSQNMREVLLVCVECFEVSAEAANFCYEASSGQRNVSGLLSAGPVVYTFSLEARVTQRRRTGDAADLWPSCNVTIGERSVELSPKSHLNSEVRGLRSLNLLTDHVDHWVRNHFNTTVKHQLQKRLLTSLSKVFTKHDACEEFIN